MTAETPDLHADPVYIQVSTTKVRRVQAGAGHLVVHDQYVDGKLIASAFTLDSLASVLGMPKTTIEGRYHRGRLCNWKVDIRTGNGRPSRGFPLALVTQVLEIIRTPGAEVKTTPTGETLVPTANPDRTRDALVPIYEGGVPFYSVGAIAAHFGVSETTIRKRLTKAGLIRRLKELSPGRHGGRPRKAFPESALGDIKLAMDEGAVFMTQMDSLLARSGGAAAQAQVDMRAAIAAHTPPASNPLIAYDHDTMTPAQVDVTAWLDDSPAPVEAPAKAGEIDAMLDELEALFPGASDAPEVVAQAEPTAPMPVVETVQETSLGDEVGAARAQAAEFAANRVRMRAEMLAALITMSDAPTPEELADTVDILDLSSDDAASFKRELADGRAARSTPQGDDNA